MFAIASIRPEIVRCYADVPGLSQYLNSTGERHSFSALNIYLQECDLIELQIIA